MKSQKVIKG